MAVPTFKRTGVHKLVCEAGCPTYAYSTVAALETQPLPRCGECGEPFVPDRYDVAASVLPPQQLERHPDHGEYMRLLAAKFHGQAPNARRRMDFGAGLVDPATLALADVLAQRRPPARKPPVHADPMPF